MPPRLRRSQFAELQRFQVDDAVAPAARERAHKRRLVWRQRPDVLRVRERLWGGDVCSVNAVRGDAGDGAVQELVKGVDLQAVGAGAV